MKTRDNHKKTREAVQACALRAAALIVNPESFKLPKSCRFRDVLPLKDFLSVFAAVEHIRRSQDLPEMSPKSNRTYMDEAARLMQDLECLSDLQECAPGVDMLTTTLSLIHATFQPARSFDTTHVWQRGSSYILNVIYFADSLPGKSARDKFLRAAASVLGDVPLFAASKRLLLEQVIPSKS